MPEILPPPPLIRRGHEWDLLVGGGEGGGVADGVLHVRRRHVHGLELLLELVHDLGAWR